MNKLVHSILIAILLTGCASKPTTTIDWGNIENQITVTHREFITLRTGQICEIKDKKIVECEKNPSMYAESVDDIKAIVGEQDEKY